MITLRHLYTLLFFIGLFFIPFNDFEGLSFLGEYKNEAASYFFLLGMLILGIEVILRGKINLPYTHILFQLICLFVLWSIVATLINLPTVLDSYYKQISGLNRFIRQFISLSISAFGFLILYWNVVRTMEITSILKNIRKVLLWGLIFAFSYGVLEFAITVMGISQITPVLKLYEYFPFVNVKLLHMNRISSVAYESPALGNYLITVSAWMFSYIATSKGFGRFLPTLMVFFLMFFSGSRAAFVVVNFQLLVFLFLLYFKQRYRTQIAQLIVAISLIIAVGFMFNSRTIVNAATEKIESLNFSKRNQHDLSNRSRFGMQYASLQVFKQNPIAGVGLGQETYHKIYEYPFWATYDNYEFKLVYKNQKLKSFPSGYNIYTRLLAETGIIGVLILLSLLSMCLYLSLQFWQRKEFDKYSVISLVLLVSFVGLFINWLQTDFFRQYGIWLSIAILSKVSFDLKSEKLLYQ